MEVELKPLACFVLLADELNFSRAAKKLNMAQPTLSAQIRNLEQRIGFALFERSTRDVSLSQKGAALLPVARKLIDESKRVGQLIDALRVRDSPPVLFGTPFYTIGIPERDKLLIGISERYPDMQLEVIANFQVELLEQLHHRQLDLALLIGQALPRAQYELERMGDTRAEIIFPDDLPRLTLRREKIELVIPEEHPLAAETVITASTLRGQKIGLLSPGHGHAIFDPIKKFFDGAGAITTIPPEAHGIAMERYCRQFRIPATVVGWFRSMGGLSDDVVYRPIDGLDVSSELALIRPGKEHTSAAAQQFWELAEAWFGPAAESPSPSGVSSATTRSAYPA